MEAGDPDHTGREMPFCWSLQLPGLAVGGAEIKVAEAQPQCSRPWAYPPAQVSWHMETSKEPKDNAPPFLWGRKGTEAPLCVTADV